MKSNMKRLPSLFAADALRDEHAAHARRPDHAGGMELDVFHVDQPGARVVGERMPVAGAIPAIARNLVGLADSARRKHDSFRAENLESAALAVIAERPDDPFAILEQRHDANLHVDVDALMDAVVLQGSNHLQPGAIADMRQPRILMPAEVPLENAAILRSIEDRAPSFQFTNAIRRFLRVQFSHAPVVDVLPAAHRISEMDLPTIAIVHVREGGRDATFRHHRVRFPQQTFANHPDRNASRRRFYRRAQSRAAGADHENVVLKGFVFGHGSVEG
jgi:hypothetical protein